MSDDLSEPVGDDKQRTRPMLETILERVNDVASSVDHLRGEVGALRAEVGTLRGEVGALREEVGTLRAEFVAFRDESRLNFQRLEKQINILNNNLLKNQANQELMEDRLETLESRVS